MHKPSHFFRYLGGLVLLFAGAWWTELTDSMFPLAMGASAALMCTVPLVRQLWTRKRRE